MSKIDEVPSVPACLPILAQGGNSGHVLPTQSTQTLCLPGYATKRGSAGLPTTCTIGGRRLPTRT